MRKFLQYVGLFAAIVSSAGLAQAQGAPSTGPVAAPQQTGSPQQPWVPTEQIKTYAITGDSPIALYSSIGDHGPQVGRHVRAIAHTDFKLTWTRRYVPQPDGSCKLTVAVPKLFIIYTLPRPASVLTGDVKSRWAVFVDGVQKHERVHGEMIKDLVRQIEAYSLGLSAASDAKCTKVRAMLQSKLGEIFPVYQQRTRDFDKVEMSEGGAVHKLILQFVNQR